MDPLEALSPIDGRYHFSTKKLASIFSEQNLMASRIMVEVEYLKALSEHPQIGVREFSSLEQGLLSSLPTLSLEEAQWIKAKECALKHDVKAVEYYLKERLQATSLQDVVEWVHFGLTSEDVNNLAYALMLSDGLGKVLLPVLEGASKTWTALASTYKGVPMLARTHEQPASPTTMGKEFKNFAVRLDRQLEGLVNFEILAKLNGAVGNYNAHAVAYPEVDWIRFSREFVARFNASPGPRRIRIAPNLVTTQIEPHDTYAELFDLLRRTNLIFMKFDRDMSRYISDKWLTLNPVEGEVGSSTMPHKVNPIQFENSLGNLLIANSWCQLFSSELPMRYLQRDLVDSTIERNFGVAFAHCLLGYQSSLKGLQQVTLDEGKMREALTQHPEVVTEALQTILRREGIPAPYEQLKALARGKRLTEADLHAFIDGLGISDELKVELRKITPAEYVGLAARLAELDP